MPRNHSTFERLPCSIRAAATLTLAATLGGAPIATTTSGTSTSITKVTNAYSVVIPDVTSIADYVLGIDWSDGASVSGRLVIPQGHQDTLPTIKSVRTDATRYAMSTQVVKPADGGQSIRVYGVDAAMTS